MEDDFPVVEFTAEVYRTAAREHVGSLQLLYDAAEYVLAIYASGVAVECMFRAYRLRTNPHFRSRHDLTELARESGFAEHVPAVLFDRFESALSIMTTRWNSTHRYRSQDALRKYLKRGRFDRGVKGDFLKENARQLLNAATDIVTLGDRLWKK